MPVVPQRLARKGIPYPFLITPESDAEARTGKALLLTDGDLETLIGAMEGSRKWHDKRLVKKLKALRVPK